MKSPYCNQARIRHAYINVLSREADITVPSDVESACTKGNVDLHMRKKKQVQEIYQGAVDTDDGLERSGDGWSAVEV